MVELPPELLGMIIDAIVEDPLPFSRQSTLAALARTNKAFNSMCGPRLYQEPVIGDEEMLEKWSRYYSSKVNPWTIWKGEKEFQKVVVPTKITFDHLSAPDSSSVHGGKRLSSTNQKPSNKHCPLLTISLAPFFFRNLTAFSVSTKSPVVEQLTATLLGPLGFNRSSIQELVLHAEARSHLPFFLLEAYNRCFDLYDSMGWDFGLAGELIEELGDSEEAEGMKQRLEEGREELTDDDWEELFDLAMSLAHHRFSVFRTIQFDSDLDEALLGIAQTRDVPCTPFNKLTRLTITIQDPVILHLILSSRLFPSLLNLKIVGDGLILEYPEDVKLLRHSVSECGGTVKLPTRSGHSRFRFPPFFDVTAFSLPLTIKEIEEEPRIDYYGPNLTMLDMSELTLTLL